MHIIFTSLHKNNILFSWSSVFRKLFIIRYYVSAYYSLFTNIPDIFQWKGFRQSFLYLRVRYVSLDKIEMQPTASVCQIQFRDIFYVWEFILYMHMEVIFYLNDLRCFIHIIYHVLSYSYISLLLLLSSTVLWYPNKFLIGKFIRNLCRFKLDACYHLSNLIATVRMINSVWLRAAVPFHRVTWIYCPNYSARW